VDQAQTHHLIAYRSGFRRDEDLEFVPHVATHGGATAVRLSQYGLAVGSPANLVLVQAPAEAVVTHPARGLVLKAGRAVVRAAYRAERANTYTKGVARRANEGTDAGAAALASREAAIRPFGTRRCRPGSTRVFKRRRPPSGRATVARCEGEARARPAGRCRPDRMLGAEAARRHWPARGILSDPAPYTPVHR
jgi:hypothetical protein